MEVFGSTVPALSKLSWGICEPPRVDGNAEGSWANSDGSVAGRRDEGPRPDLEDSRAAVTGGRSCGKGVGLGRKSLSIPRVSIAPSSGCDTKDVCESPNLKELIILVPVVTGIFLFLEPS